MAYNGTYHRSRSKEHPPSTNERVPTNPARRVRGSSIEVVCVYVLGNTAHWPGRDA